jgi:DNA polymerase-3 subunit beta
MLLRNVVHDSGGDAVELVASDSEVTFMAQCPAQVHAEGAVILPGKMLAEVSKYWTGDSAAFEREGTTMKIMASRSQFTLSASDGEKYPRWSESPVSIAEVDAAEFSAAIRKISPASGKTIPGKAYGAVYLAPEQGKLNMVCTDGSSMGVMGIPFDCHEENFPPSAKAPVPVLERFARLAEGKVTLGWSEGNLISADYPGLRVLSRQVAGEFPKWENVFRSAPENWVTADTAELSRLVKMAQLAAPDDRIEMTFDRNDLHVTARSAENKAAGYTETDYEGDALSFLFGGDRILDALRGCGDKVQIAFTAPNRAVYFRSEGLYYLVQPRRDLEVSS